MRDTLDTIGTVVASVSNRVDAQTGALERVNKTTMKLGKRPLRQRPKRILSITARSSAKSQNG